MVYLFCGLLLLLPRCDVLLERKYMTPVFVVWLISIAAGAPIHLLQMLG